MSPKEQNMAIAKACGWDGFEDSISPEFPPIGVPPQNEVTERLLGPQKITNWTPRFDVPDYARNLNAMSEAEKYIPSELLYRYARFLVRATTGRKEMSLKYSETAKVLRATAAQRAEAFLRTLDLWLEDSPKGE